jgi:hypothetical protein
LASPDYWEQQPLGDNRSPTICPRGSAASFRIRVGRLGTPSSRRTSGGPPRRRLVIALAVVPAVDGTVLFRRKLGRCSQPPPDR